MTTKLHDDGSVDFDAVAADVDFLLEGGVDGLICCGSLGEASVLNREEKLALTTAAAKAAGGKVPVLLAIAEDATRDACDLAARASAAGADGLMVLPGMRYVADAAETKAHFAAVAGAADLPIMIYNNPVAYGVDITPEMFAEMAGEDAFVAIKESSADLRRITDIINLSGDRYRIFAGVDDIALESLMLGAVGWVAGLVCAFPRETVALYRLAKAGRFDEARELYRWFMPLLHLDVSMKLVQNIKLVEHLTRGTSTAVRLPRLALSGAAYDTVCHVVDAALARRPDVDSYGV